MLYRVWSKEGTDSAAICRKILRYVDADGTAIGSMISDTVAFVCTADEEGAKVLTSTLVTRSDVVMFQEMNTSNYEWAPRATLCPGSDGFIAGEISTAKVVAS